MTDYYFLGPLIQRMRAGSWLPLTIVLIFVVTLVVVLVVHVWRAELTKAEWRTSLCQCSADDIRSIAEGGADPDELIEMECDRDDYGLMRPLHYVVRSCPVQAVEALLSSGATLSVKDEDGRTAMFYAMERCDAEVTRLLLDKGADPNVQAERDLTPLYWFVETCGVPEVLSALIEYDVADKERAFIRAAALGDREVVLMLMDAGTDIEADSYLGGGALAAAAVQTLDGWWDRPGKRMPAGGRQHEQIIDDILSSGVSDEDLNHELREVCSWGGGSARSIIEIFLDHGADIDSAVSTHWGGMTALHQAAKYGHIDTIRARVDYGADVDIRDGSGLRPIDYICHRDDLACEDLENLLGPCECSE